MHKQTNKTNIKIHQTKLKKKQQKMQTPNKKL